MLSGFFAGKLHFGALSLLCVRYYFILILLASKRQKQTADEVIKTNTALTPTFVIRLEHLLDACNARKKE